MAIMGQFRGDEHHKTGLIVADRQGFRSRTFIGSSPARVGLAAAAFALAAPSFAQLPVAGGPASQAAAPGGSEAVVNGGLAVRIVFIGRNKDGQRLTVSAQITNVNEQTAHVALIGKPTAVNNVGETFALEQASGIGHCAGELHICMTQRNWLPLEALSEIQPQASVNAVLTFVAPDASETQFLSVGMNVAMALGDTVAEAAKDKLRNVSISFPLVEF